MTTRIFILGIGGVGGYFGGKLAGFYENSPEVEIVFLARGKNKEAIREKGLKLSTTAGETVVHPALCTDDPGEAGVADVLIVSVKSYDLENSLSAWKACIGEKTIVIPLLNGVDASERIRAMFPHNLVCDGCTYLVSRLVSPGEIRETGKIGLLFFGNGNADDARLESLVEIFRAAGIDAHSPADIREIAWEKFLFISSIATLTSWLNCTVGDLLNQPEKNKLLLGLLGEMQQLAHAKKIHLPENAVPKILERMRSLPPATTSSMHSDFQKGGKTEMESLTGYVVRLGKELGIPTPGFDRAYEGLQF